MPVPNHAEAVPGNGAINAPVKRKTSTRRGASAGAARPAAKRSAEPSEILFTEPPNPYRQPEPPYIWIDHPQERERLLGPVYVIRLGVGGAQNVEISIDKGPWVPCRFTSGYWWYDWTAIAPGKHVLVARMKAFDGRYFRTPPRNCEYRP